MTVSLTTPVPRTTLFLIDEDVSIRLAELLSQRGYDAVTTRQLGLAGRGTPDSEILTTAIELEAQAENRPF